MRGQEYAELAAFVGVAERRSFANAARQLRIAPSTLSQIIKNLEARLGVQLLQRTTRSVSLTGAGAQLLARFQPAMLEMQAAVSDLQELREAPAGTVRIHLQRAAYATFLERAFARFQKTYPGIRLDVVVDDTLTNLVGDGFDIDVRRANQVDPSMRATPIGGLIRHVAVASPAYLGLQGRPREPSDLARHRCISWRRPGTSEPQAWTFEVDGRPMSVDVDGAMIVSHCEIAVRAARAGVGIAFVLERYARSAVASGALRSLLASFLPRGPGWALVHPRRSRLSPAGEAVADFLLREARGTFRMRRRPTPPHGPSLSSSQAE